MAVYNPPHAVTTLEIPYLSLVVRADPDFEKKKHREIEYQFAGPNFYADPTNRGAYNDHDN
jgi:hypothetical protein